jgi:hypothetical protein
MKNVDTEELSEWIGRNLFPEDFSDTHYFESSLTLYSATIYRTPIATLIHASHKLPNFQLSEHQLNQVLLESCQELKIIPGAYWFQVNSPDNVLQIVVAVGIYSYRHPLVPLYERLHCFPAEEGGVTIVGLLGKNRDWMFTIEYENQLILSVHGSKAFCGKIKEKVIPK